MGATAPPGFDHQVGALQHFEVTDTHGRLIECGAASSFTVASPSISPPRIARRVGSARAANVMLNSSVFI